MTMRAVLIFVGWHSRNKKRSAAILDQNISGVEGDQPLGRGPRIAMEFCFYFWAEKMEQVMAVSIPGQPARARPCTGAVVGGYRRTPAGGL